jgi:dipeptide/tripeptide permease
VYEVFERMAYYGISSNLVLYLTTKLHQGTVSSANNVTNWVGTIWMTPILGAYIADAHLGRYRTFMIASLIYLIVSPSPTPSPSIYSRARESWNRSNELYPLC